ncbi:MAG: J domain-containing protein [Desulfatiglandaceae bacterium]|jgi:hypothetical protein
MWELKSIVEMHLQKAAEKKPVRRAAPRRTGKCLACGTDKMNGGRRYCSKECRQHIVWVLSLSKGLLRTFNTRYAAFSFTGNYVVLDILPVWTKGISRFVWPRTKGRKPALDLKDLVLESGREWHHMVDHKNSRSLASLHLLQRNHEAHLRPESIKPSKCSRPRLSKEEGESLKILKIEKEILSTENCTSRIKSAYKRLAKRYHPDMGGDEEAFKRLNDAHEQMLMWMENPQYTCRKALLNSWSYDSTVNRWTPPL